MNVLGMAAVDEAQSSSSSLSSSSTSSNSPRQSVEGGDDLPHLKLRVGGGLCVSIQTTGSPTPPCLTDGLRSHSTKQILDCREHPCHKVRFRSARLPRSTSNLTSDSRMLPVAEELRYLQSPVPLNMYEERKCLKVSGVSWSPMASVDVRHKPKDSISSSHRGQGEPQSECASRTSKQTCMLSKSQPYERSLSFSCARGETNSLLSRKQTQPPSRRRTLTDYEKNLTFKPKLNDYSIKIASRNARLSLPVINRLSEARRNESLPRYDQEHLTFTPKLNPLSLKLAHERATRMPEVYTQYNQLYFTFTS